LGVCQRSSVGSAEPVEQVTSQWTPSHKTVVEVSGQRLADALTQRSISALDSARVSKAGKCPITEGYAFRAAERTITISRHCRRTSRQVEGSINCVATVRTQRPELGVRWRLGGWIRRQHGRSARGAGAYSGGWVGRSPHLGARVGEGPAGLDLRPLQSWTHTEHRGQARLRLVV